MWLHCIRDEACCVAVPKIRFIYIVKKGSPPLCLHFSLWNRGKGEHAPQLSDCSVARSLAASSSHPVVQNLVTWPPTLLQGSLGNVVLFLDDIISIHNQGSMTTEARERMVREILCNMKLSKNSHTRVKIK